MKTLIQAIALTLTFSAASGVVNAQPAGAYPAGPIHLVVGVPPGGNVDTLARVLVRQLEQQLPHPIVVDNRGGVSGIVGYDIVAKARPDGYRRFGADLLLFELVNATTAASATAQKSMAGSAKATKVGKGVGTDKPVAEWLAEISSTQRELFESIEGFVLSMGDDVQRKELKLYVAYKRFRNFVSAVVQKDKFVLYLRLDPTKVELVKGFTRDVRNIGHWATGDLEVNVGDAADFERAKSLIQQAYVGGPSAG